jgi:hypothetical protein
MVTSSNTNIAVCSLGIMGLILLVVVIQTQITKIWQDHIFCRCHNLIHISLTAKHWFAPHWTQTARER